MAVNGLRFGVREFCRGDCVGTDVRGFCGFADFCIFVLIGWFSVCWIGDTVCRGFVAAVLCDGAALRPCFCLLGLAVGEGKCAKMGGYFWGGRRPNLGRVAGEMVNSLE